MRKLTLILVLLLLSSGCANKKVLTYTGAGIGGAGGIMIGGMFGMVLSGALGGGELDTKGKIVLPLSMIIGGLLGAGGGMALGSGLDQAISD